MGNYRMMLWSWGAPDAPPPSAQVPAASRYRYSARVNEVYKLSLWLISFLLR